MMWIAECNIDERGRITLPKSFLKANNLTKYTKVYIQSAYNTTNAVKMVFENDKEGDNANKKDNE